MKTRPLRIAQVPPLWAKIPPQTYGGIELVVNLLTEELVRRGHEVTLFGTADSQTSARLRPVFETNLLEFMSTTGACVYETYANAAVARVLAQAADYDIIHFHIGTNWIPFATLSLAPCLFTIHTFVGFDDIWLARNFPGIALAGVSGYQVRQLAAESGRAIPVVYNGCNFDAFQPSEEACEYLAFLGRMGEDKNPLDAIRIAQSSGWPIVLAGQPQQAKEEAYFAREIQPLIDGKAVRYLGPVDHAQKNELLRHAAALLFPVQWPEPFGLVMIEAMACGTPVLGRALGAVTEVVEPGVTGYHAAEIAGLHELVAPAVALDRVRVREQARGRFSYQSMVDRYLELYHELAAR